MQNMKVVELRALAKEKGLKGYSKLNKIQLINLLKDPEIEEVFLEELDKEVEVIQYKDGEDWLETRKLGIGGSESSAIMNCSRYKSGADVWLDKMGKGKKIENRFTYFGNKLEPMVADVFSEKHPEFEVKELNKTLKRKHSVANIDRLLKHKETGKFGVLEIKTTSAFKSNEWKGDECPEEYYAQVMHYLAVTGLEYAYIACLVGGNDYYEFIIDRKEDECEFILKNCEYWWKEYVEKGICPPPDGSGKYSEYQNEQISKLEESILEIDEDEKILNYDEICKTIQTLEKEKKKIQQEWIEEMIRAGCNKAKVGKYKISTQIQKRETLNKEKIKLEIPNFERFLDVKEIKFFKVS